jgi:hypothetical protein
LIVWMLEKLMHWLLRVSVYLRFYVWPNCYFVVRAHLNKQILEWMVNKIPNAIRLRQTQVHQMIVFSLKSIPVLVHLVNSRKLPNFNYTFNSSSEENITSATCSKQRSSVSAHRQIWLNITTGLTLLLFEIRHVPQLHHAVFRHCCKRLFILSQVSRSHNVEVASQNVLLLNVCDLRLFYLLSDLIYNLILFNGWTYFKVLDWLS